MARVAELPGYGPVRAATLITYLDTPGGSRARRPCGSTWGSD
jgi:hypothetical protein